MRPEAIAESLESLRRRFDAGEDVLDALEVLVEELERAGLETSRARARLPALEAESDQLAREVRFLETYLELLDTLDPPGVAP